MNDPMSTHKCRMVARAIALDDRRDYWLGELLEPISGYPDETHCLHITTPTKLVVFGINLGDAMAMATFAYIIHGAPFDPHWLEGMARAYEIKARQQPQTSQDAQQ